MRILAIESALLGGSVALLHGDSLLAEVVLDVERRTARTLLPAVQSLLVREGWRPRDVQLVAVTLGPGSFTGLRIGATAAKIFAYATGARVLGVSSLAVLAAQVMATSNQLWAVMDAEREQLFAARFRLDGNVWIEEVPVHIVDKASWIMELTPGMLVTGPVLGAMRGRLARGVAIAPADVWNPRASTVGQLAYQLYSAGHRADIWSILPSYLRLSAAEEKGKLSEESGGIARP